MSAASAAVFACQTAAATPLAMAVAIELPVMMGV
jgi:hypothetical protein